MNIIRLFVIAALLLASNQLYAQHAKFLKGKGYKGFVFPKEYAVWGFPPEKGRYTPSSEDIENAEEILANSMNTAYVLNKQKQYKRPPINRKTLKRYIRQYVGHVLPDSSAVVEIFLHRGLDMNDEDFARDVLEVLDGAPIIGIFE